MSTASTQQIPKRNHRQRKAPAAAAAQQQIPILYESNNDAQPSTTPSKPKKKKQNQRAQQQSQSDNGLPNNNPVSPLTPPRLNNQTEVNGSDVHVSPVANASQQNGKGKKKNSSNGQRDSPTATPKPRKSRSPQPDHPPCTTPAKATQIYAGPTFHASPAASALPIPKFFSKSMPQVDNKEASLQAMMQDDVSEESNSQGDVSPTMRNPIRVEEQKARDESPLDIFFQADRAEKARRQAEDQRSNLSTPNDRFRASSASPARFQSPHHSRQPTDSSIFPLEMDGEHWKSAPWLAKPASSAPSGLENSPMISPKTDLAKTEALKQFLFSKTQEQNNTGLPSPSLSPTPTRTGQHYTTSPNFRSRSSSPYSSIYGGNLADSRPMPARTQSSQLRQEVSAEHVSELPTTPTPSRSQHLFADSPNMKASNQQFRHASPRPAVKFEAQDALKVSLGNKVNAHASNEDMEAKIREILKLGSLSSTGVR
ncbi:MAG: hypothetical protein MMC23_008046 [Stictis urceolatum]|nr:hypothetical protein [Stictis urceolata]